MDRPSNIIRLPHRVVHVPVKPITTHDELAAAIDLYESLKAAPQPTWRDELKADWREFVSEVRGSPYSHALVAIGAVIFWTVLLVAPLLLGLGK